MRTHLMRPTWHLVSADDIYWMLELTKPQIKSQSKSRHHDLGLTGEVLSASRTVYWVKTPFGAGVQFLILSILLKFYAGF